MDFNLKTDEELLTLYDEELLSQYESFRANLTFANQLREEILYRMRGNKPKNEIPND